VSNVEYDDFYNNLKDNSMKEKLKEILDKLIIEKSDIIKSEIDIDRKHIEMVNYCTNLFLPHTILFEATGYSLMLYEPLINMNIPNFDIAVYNKDEKILILIECKSSLSNPKKKIGDIKKSINSTQNNIDNIKTYIGDEIKYIEYVICLPITNAIELIEIVFSKDIPICIWGLDAFNNIIKIYNHKDEVHTELLNKGRCHRNNELNRLLYKGVKSSIKSSRTCPILYSSHICTILLHVTMLLITKFYHITEWDGNFDAHDILLILKDSIAKPNTLQENDYEQLTIKVIDIGKVKEIFFDSTPNIIEIENKLFRFTKKIKSSIVENFVKSNYIALNAKKLAKKIAVEEFKNITGWKEISSYFKNE